MSVVKIEKLQDVVRDYVRGTVLSQQTVRLTAPGENYGSVLLKLDIKVRDGDKEEEIHAVAKCVPPNKSIREIFNTKATFPNEIAWYTTIIPTMIKFQRDNGVEDVIDCFPKFYGARTSLDPEETIDEHGLILLENLAETGYRNENRYVGFDLSTSQSIIKNLAAFHSIPIAIKLRNLELFETNIKKFLYGFENVGQVEPEVKQIFEAPLRVMEEITELAHLIPRVKKGMAVNAFVISDVREPWATTLHHDFWMNNIMVKPGDPPKSAIIDLQTTVYGSFATDLVFFLMTSVEISVAEQHLGNLIDTYYEEFIRNLRQLKVDTEIFNREAFMKELNVAAAGQLPHCIFFAVVMCAEKKNAQDTTTEEYNHMKNLKEMSGEDTVRHRRRYRFIVEQFAKRNWI
ncbi:uncharacterized protein LOC132703552 [Cylas formicarius]|uniref:uncharacterized protein LOC132703552 n=1 Tax=Cylas formicarius TaxID=197179 RepID=UPI002958DEEB|nr:uncharacterized protein LOC132703552 [Cylas formicarius]